MSKTISWSFGFLIAFLGILNIIYGNDADFGCFLVLVSFLYYPPVTNFIKKRFAISIPTWIKIVLALLLIWFNLAVGAIAEGFVF